jgi:urease accessory protein
MAAHGPPPSLTLPRKRGGNKLPSAATIEDQDSVFAANRSAGRIALSVAAESGVTRRRQVYEDGPLRVRFPNAGEGALEAVIVNTAGGIAGGDRHDLDVQVEGGASLTVTTAAAEKIYRSLGPPAEISVALSVAAGARLNWLPQETILFDRARLSRRIDVELAAGATLLVAEALLFGRSAMGETVEEGALTDRWRVRYDGRLLFAETVRLDGPVARILAEPAVAAGGCAIATLLAIPGDEAMVERARAQTFCGEVGVSAWNGLAAARLCAKDGASLRRDLLALVGAWGGRAPRLWLN